MKTETLLGLAALGGLAYTVWRKQTSPTDFVVGAVVTGVIVYALDESGIIALANPVDPNGNGMGKMSSKAVKYLTQVDAETLYRPAKVGGVTIGAVPSDPNIVNQEP